MSEKAARKAPAKKTGARKAAAKKTAPKAVKKKEAVVEVTGKKAAEMKPVPAATVLVRHEREMQQRDARGYSLGELGSAGMTFIAARKSHVPVDIRRRSVLEGNVGKLKVWYVPEPKKAKVETAEGAEKPAKAVKKKTAKTAKA